MAATKQDIDRWIARAKEMGATHVVSVCDTFEYDDYPVYVMPDDDVEEVADRVRGSKMQAINEIIKIGDE